MKFDYLKKYVRTEPDYPEKGVMYRDITTVLKNREIFKSTIDAMNELLQDVDFDMVVSPDSRGHIFASPIAYLNSVGMEIARKPGKLPCETIEEQYTLEYGTATLQMHKDAIEKGQKVVIIDDLMATGGTIQAIIKMIERLGGEVACVCCFIELPELNGREALKGYDVRSVISFNEDEV